METMMMKPSAECRAPSGLLWTLLCHLFATRPGHRGLNALWTESRAPSGPLWTCPQSPGVALLILLSKLRCPVSSEGDSFWKRRVLKTVKGMRFLFISLSLAIFGAAATGTVAINHSWVAANQDLAMALLFGLGYAGIVFEESLAFNKSGVGLLMAVSLWVIRSIGTLLLAGTMTVEWDMSILLNHPDVLEQRSMHILDKNVWHRTPIFPSCRTSNVLSKKH